MLCLVSVERPSPQIENVRRLLLSTRLQAIDFFVDIAYFLPGLFNSDYFSAPNTFLALLIA